MSNHNVTLVLGANGSIGQYVTEYEASYGLVVGTYRKKDKVTTRLQQNPNVFMYYQDFLENSDTKDLVDFARSKGTINKVYFLAGESWKVAWDNCTLTDFRKSIDLCALPVASLIKELEPELTDTENFMRWAQISGMASRIVTDGPNKPTTGGAKLLAEFYFQSASAYYSHCKNVFTTLVLGYSRRTKNHSAGYNAKDVENQPLIGYQSDARDSAEYLIWLNSKSNKYITGTTILADGGTSIRTREKYSESKD